MAKKYNTNLKGLPFSQETQLRVWDKAQKIRGLFDKAHLYRKDRYGNEIHWNQYGNTDHPHGWEIDHLKPKARDGTDHLNNLQPLQWEENRIKGDRYPYDDNLRKKLRSTLN